MKKIIHRAADRGKQNHGWLQAAHSFSFGNFHDPSRVNFGALRVLNDDIIAGGMGFGLHGHENMEIVTIPLRGTLAHKDSLGSKGTISYGEVQIMSAGTGIRHSEFNGSETEEVNLLQIWIFPKKQDITPKYDQKPFAQPENNFVTVVSPNAEDHALWINQDAVFSTGNFKAGQTGNYSMKYPENGVYIFVIEGSAEVAGITLTQRDAIGISEADTVQLNFPEDCKVLLIEVPMEF